MPRIRLRIVIAFAGLAALLFGVAAASAQTLTGTVAGSSQQLAGANVRILELNRITHTGGDGTFAFAHVPAGTYHVFASLIGYASVTQSVDVSGDGGSVSFQLKTSAIPIKEVVVSASPDARTADNVYQSAEARSRVDLMNSAGSSIAEKLSDIPGVNVRGCGSAPTRPILRGLSDNRVLVLENGLRTGDLATFDPAHATPIEGIGVSEIDVVRGPASILYGPSTIGGLVDVITNIVPALSDRAVSGTMTVEGNSVSDLYSGFFRTVMSSGRSAFSVSAGGVHANDTHIPSGTYTDPASGFSYNLDRLPQTFDHSGEGGFGWSYTGNTGSIGIGAKHYEMNYGIPGDPLSTDFADMPPSTSRIAQRRNTLELDGTKSVGDGFVKQLKLNASYNDYHHGEYPLAQDPVTGVVSDPEENSFHKQSFNGVLQLQQKMASHVQGTLGLWTNLEKMSIGGDQPLGPNSMTSGFAAYAFEEYVTSDRARFQGGLRFDYNKIQTNPDAASPITAFQTLDTARNSNAVTASLGAIRKFTPELTGSVSVARSFRAPTVQELFANGLDAPSASYMIGNPDLTPETGIGIDASLKGNYERMSFEFSPYVNIVSDYIYAFENGDTTIDAVDWPILRFARTDARLAGFEAAMTVAPTAHLALRASSDYVEAQDTKANQPLPFTPPLRGLLRATWQTSISMAMVEWRGAAAQKRLADGETPTAGYGILNLGAGVRMTRGAMVHNVSVHCDNVFDRDYRDHVSVIKDFLPQPGRGFRLNYELNY